VAERRDLPEQLREDVLTGDEQLDRVDTRVRRSLDKVFALGREEAGLDAVLAGSEELPDEPELLVLTRFDQAVLEPGSASSAALARSATAANA
jgi:hypothetical protein